MDKIIRMVRLGADVYINRDDVISLIKDYQLKGESLGAQNDLKMLAETLSEGIKSKPTEEGE